MHPALSAALASDRLHHAYLFEGPPGAGKAAAARQLAMRLLCQLETGCGECPPCQKVKSELHPDVVAFDMTPKGLTERVRELIATLGFSPHEGRARIVLFDPAHGLAPVPERAEAANVLLKTLEEPPRATYFVLVTSEPRRLPATVRSRCQRIRFAPPEVAADGLDEQVALFTDALGQTSASSLFGAASELSADREETIAFSLALWRRLYEALLLREGLGNENANENVRRLAQRSTAGILRSLSALDEATESLRGNVAPQLVVEHLILTLRENA